jgi:tRNA (cytidine/uridine-2'-O-)-methyltransferase
MPTSPPLLNIILHEPEIPNNTGNIGRTCIATGCALHLIRPLGFDTSEKACRRAGLDYWPRLQPTEHDHWPAYLATARPAAERLWIFTTKTARPLWDADFRPGDHLLFGKEGSGLPATFLSEYPDRLVTLPMIPDERSLNLATAVCAAIYEALRQMTDRGELIVNGSGRIVRRADMGPAR